MTFDTHLSMTTHKMGEYWFSEEVKLQCLRNTSGIAVKLSKWTRDIGVVTRNVVPCTWKFLRDEIFTNFANDVMFANI